MSFETWLLFSLTETVLCFTPGPAVLLVISMALSRGAVPGLLASCGILVANAGYFLFSATGIGAIVLASWELFFLIKWVGAAYLIWLGGKALFGRATAIDADTTRPPRAQRAFTVGVITQGANPKALVFFTALLPQFIEPEAPVAPQVLILGVTSIVIEFVVLAIYVALAQRARRFATRPAVAANLQRAGGALLIGAGAGLAALRRN
jgi:homoserine/homoserine lactone efflux protein